MSQIVLASTLRMLVLAGVALKTKNIIKKIRKSSIRFNFIEFIGEVVLMSLVVRVAWGVC